MSFPGYSKIALGVMVASLALLRPASAANGNIPFAGNLVNLCIINVVSGGNLGISSNYRTLASGQPGGTLGRATVTTTGAGMMLSVDQPTAFDSAPGDDTSPTTFLARYRTTGATVIGGLTSASNALGRGLTNVQVHLRTSKSGANTFAAGDYTATVVLRCE